MWSHPPVRRLDVEQHRVRDHHRAVAGTRGPPAEVDVVPEEREPLVEAEPLENVAADQHPGGVDRQDVADAVVLALVVLAALEARLPAAGAADGDADLEQPPERGPLAQLGAEHVGGGSGGGDREQLLERVGAGSAVVVEEPDPVVVAGRFRQGGEGGGDRVAVRAGGRGVEDRPLTKAAAEQGDALVGAAGVDGDDVVQWPGLVG